jgi:hypothetical protein
VAGGIVALLVFATLVASWQVVARTDLIPPANEYNIAAWETRNFPNKWLFLAGEAIHGKAPEAKQDEVLARFFDLTKQIEALEPKVSDANQQASPEAESLVTQLNDLRRERDSLENQAEDTIEGRITQVLKEQGLERDFLASLVWPPVDTEFTDAPRTLAISPRDRIELSETSLLREDLSIVDVENIEDQTASEDNVSALAFPLGGLGAYPTIVDYPDNYEDAVATVAHEWMHNYLFFRPLGFNYYKDNDVRTINETVADLVGHEIAGIVVDRWPLPSRVSPGGAQQPTRQPGIDVGAELRALRGEVDVLLAQGKVDEAEALMEQRREELAAKGYYIRKINQAYFAFLNLYSGAAGSGASTNPIGPKVDELRAKTGSLHDFVSVIGSVTSVAELDQALAALQ